MQEQLRKLFPIILLLRVATTAASVTSNEIPQDDYSLKDMIASTHNCSLSIAAAKIMTFLTLFCGCFLAFSNAAKAFQITKDTTQISANSKWLLNAIGYANISTGVTTLLLLYASEYLTTSQAIALGILPRIYTMIRYYIFGSNNKEFTLVLHGLVPTYGIILALIATMFPEKLPEGLIAGLDIDPELAMKIIGYIYLSAGTALIIAPVPFGQLLNYHVKDDAFGIGLLRSGAGKTDLVSGGLLLGLGMGYPVEKALGVANMAWLSSILVGDLYFKSYVPMGKSLCGVLVQLCIAIAASKAMCPFF